MFQSPRDRPWARFSFLIFHLSFLSCISGCQSPPAENASSVQVLFGEQGLGNGQFSYPRAIAISPIDGHVVVCDKTARIQRFDPDGRFEAVWRMPEWEFGKPTGMAFDMNGLLWVADTHYNRVIVYDRNGEEQFRFGKYGQGPGEFIFPTSVAWDPDGNIYVGEYGGNDRISKFSPDRKYLMSFGTKSSGDAALERPTQIKFDPRGFLWVSDGCHHRICRFSTDGKLLGSFGRPGSGPGEMNYPYDLDLVPGTTHIVVTEHGNNRISEFDDQGRLVRWWGKPGRDRGEIMQPWKAQFGRNGLLYIVDAWNNRVQAVRW